MFYRSILIGSLLTLGACSYVVDKEIQELTIVTPGAYNSLCYAYVGGLKYKFRPPQTLTIGQSREDLVVDCMAPGNRRKKVIIEPYIPDSFLGNAVTGAVPGAVWDFTSEAMFKYPSTVEVNFVNTPITPEALPSQNQPDIVQPEEYHLEEFLPGRPRLNDDRYMLETQIQRVQRGGSEVPEGGYVAETITEGADVGKGTPDSVSPSSVVETYDDVINPSGAPTPTPSGTSGADAPIPLFPGE